MPVAVDFALAFAVLVIASAYEYVSFWPRFRAAVAAGHASARTRAYRRGMIGQWLLALAAVAIWTAYARRWGELRLAVPHGWRLALAVVFVALAVGLVVLQLWSVARLAPERRVAARPKLGKVAFMLPHTAREYGWFVALSITAGWCEELLYRGYLPWLLAPWLGQVGAMAVVVVAFGIGHAYQGRKGAIRATIAGAAMAAIVLASGSLMPAMVVHALIDIGGGTAGYWLLRDQKSKDVVGPPGIIALARGAV